MRIAYITSMKRGLPSFIYKELVELQEHGIPFAIFVTRSGSGIYMPDPGWAVHTFNLIRSLIAHFYLVLRWPLRYLSLCALSLRTGSLVDFALAADFAVAGLRWKITSIHCKEGLHSLNLGYYAHLLLDIPLSLTIYADALYAQPNAELFRLALSACQRIITVCDFNREILLRDYSVEPERVQTIPLYVDLVKFRPDPRTRILMVAQFAERKGHDVLFQAIKQLGRSDIVVWVVGGQMIGGEKVLVDVPGLARKYGIDNQVLFLGNVSEDVLQILYQDCDIFCLPSRFRGVREGTPVALMEAMAYQRPVISTRHAGIPEYVEHVLTSEDSVSDLAKAIEYLVDHPGIRLAQGKRNREIVERKFSRENIEKLALSLAEVDAASSARSTRL